MIASENLSQRFSKHLLLTNTAISFTQIGTADVMQQLFQGDIQRKGWDYSRTARMAAIGFVMGPMLHGFYRVLDSRPFTGGRRKVVMKKLCCDAICMPIFSCTFMTGGRINLASSAIDFILVLTTVGSGCLCEYCIIDV
ncbi:hypothetical protein TELCIR_13645 [Teladorsagia circumcincta]|uniref:Mpv17 / PMP22 family protein n=1 Tax=Teladorsagia circumcincta TaxID=45464 RepID=A0A2G9U365_TELCI|nr:hypothetical protein TELCIR_13645 [Teladorsagia circumcincta]